MRRIKSAITTMLITICTVAAVNAQGSVKYKCMIQMNSYLGQGAYIVVSIVDKDSNYDKTLYVLGDDNKWYPDLKEWHKAYQKKQANISAITGASVSSGDRAMVTLEIDKDKINSGYTLRFESAVENEPYYQKDAEVPLTSEGLAAKTEGKGYIRYVRFSGN